MALTLCIVVLDKAAIMERRAREDALLKRQEDMAAQESLAMRQVSRTAHRSMTVHGKKAVVKAGEYVRIPGSGNPCLNSTRSRE